MVSRELKARDQDIQEKEVRRNDEATDLFDRLRGVEYTNKELASKKNRLRDELEALEDHCKVIQHQN